MTELERQLPQLRRQVEDYLFACFQGQVPYQTLYEAMRYSLCSGGKRVRPVLTMLFAQAAGGSPQAALPLGCGVEMLHTYSLIHDDLPCMDDDELRRGKPTSHVVFGQANAVLAGDALQAAAFECVLSALLPAQVVAQAGLELARGAGRDGMCAGQMLDIAGEGKPLTLEQLRRIHEKKTGALLESACVMGVLCAQGSQEQLLAARDYAREIGLAFQVRDDVLDHTSTTQELGKPVGSDEANHKTTYYTLLGEAGCQTLIDQCTARAKARVEQVFPHSVLLCQMADALADRRH